jgi:hypothetical protein
MSSEVTHRGDEISRIYWFTEMSSEACRQRPFSVYCSGERRQSDAWDSAADLRIECTNSADQRITILVWHGDVAHQQLRAEGQHRIEAFVRRGLTLHIGSGLLENGADELPCVCVILDQKNAQPDQAG